MGGALRMLQAGEFRLDEPLLTSADLPETLKSLTLEARFHSVAQVVKTAIARQVDVVIVAGNAFDWSQDRRPAWFLAEQFNRLDHAGIQVIWAELSEADFPAIVPLPSNVHCVTPHTRSLVHADGTTIEVCWDWHNAPATTSQHVDASITFHRGDQGISQSITSVLYTSRKHPELQAPLRLPVTSVQGHSAKEPGPHGVQLISWNGSIENQFIATDTVRWVSESIEVTPNTTRTSLIAELQQRQQRVLKDHPASENRLTICHWRFSGTGEFWDELLHLNFEELGQTVVQDQPGLHHFWTANTDLVPDAEQLSQWGGYEPMSIGFGELDLHFDGSENLIPESYHKPHWATQLKTSSIKKTVIPQLVRGLQTNTST